MVRYTAYCYFFTCDPRTSPQYRVQPFAIKKVAVPWCKRSQNGYQQRYDIRQTFKYTHKSVVLSAVLHGCESWSIALREEHTEGLWETFTRGEYLDPRYEQWDENGKNYIISTLITRQVARTWIWGISCKMLNRRQSEAILWGTSG